MSGSPEGDAVFKKYGIEGTPTELIVGADGAELDWHSGYNPPPEDFLAKLEATAKGIDTYQALSERYARDPKDALTVFKLALKLEDRWEDKALEKWKEGVALDPAGASGSFVTGDSFKARVTYTEYAEYQLALAALRTAGRPDLLPMRAFIKKYPQSEFLEMADMFLSGPYLRSEDKAGARSFFEEYVTRFPNSPAALSYYLRFIIRTGENLERGAQLAGRLESLEKFHSYFGMDNQALADFYLLKGDRTLADEAYGPSALDTRTKIFASELIRYADYWGGRKENTESALKAVDTALGLASGPYYILRAAGEAYLKLGRPDKALAVIGPEYAKKNWNDSGNLWAHANFWAGEGLHLDDALASARRILELEPKDPSSWDILALVLAKQKKYAEAIQAAEKAVALATGSDAPFYERKLKQLKAEAAKEKK